MLKEAEAGDKIGWGEVRDRPIGSTNNKPSSRDRGALNEDWK